MRARAKRAAQRPMRVETETPRGVVRRRGPVRSGAGVAAGSAAHGANAREGRRVAGVYCRANIGPEPFMQIQNALMCMRKQRPWQT